MYVITKDNKIVGHLLPRLQTVPYIERIDPTMLFRTQQEANRIIVMIEAVEEYQGFEYLCVNEDKVPSVFTEIGFRRGSKTTRPIKWGVPSGSPYCSVCGVSIPAVDYMIVDSIRFCPFCARNHCEKAQQIIDGMAEAQREEYYNVFLLENL